MPIHTLGRMEDSRDVDERRAYLLSDEDRDALLDALSYFKLCDYGDGEMRPLDSEREAFRVRIDALEARLSC